MPKFMKCPYCGNVFPISEEEELFNSTFRCPKCHKHNQGSTRSENGILIGEKESDG